MFNMGFTEIIVLSVIALLVIGPKQLPEVARVIGRMLNEFKRATGDISSSLAGVKREAQGFANKTQSYMHQQREEFEKKLKESAGLEEEELSLGKAHSDEILTPSEAEALKSTESEEADQMNFDLDKGSDKGQDS